MAFLESTDPSVSLQPRGNLTSNNNSSSTTSSMGIFHSVKKALSGRSVFYI